MRIALKIERCGHCGGPIPLGEYWYRVDRMKKYCSRRCRKNASTMRRYYKHRELKSKIHVRDMERRRIASVKWRAEADKDGRCVRCGRDNDRLELGFKTCTNCIIALKG